MSSAGSAKTRRRRNRSCDSLIRRRRSLETLYREAVDLATELNMRPLVAHCHLGLGKIYRRTAKPEQAQEHLAAAMTMYRDMGMTYWLEKAEVS
jgi:sugar phosphate isomerase/epimerase